MLRLTRRQLLNGLSLAAAAGLWGLVVPRTRPAAAASDREYELWSGMVGRSFRLGPGFEFCSGPLPELRLEQVSLCAYRKDYHRPAHLRPAAISLLFSVDGAGAFAAATYRVDHPRLGRTLLYLQPTPRAEYPDKAIYEAVLN